MIAVLLILIGGGVILYLALAGLAIIYSMGANESPRGRRIFFAMVGIVVLVDKFLPGFNVNRAACSRTGKQAARLGGGQSS